MPAEKSRLPAAEMLIERSRDEEEHECTARAEERGGSEWVRVCIDVVEAVYVSIGM